MEGRRESQPRITSSRGLLGVSGAFGWGSRPTLVVLNTVLSFNIRIGGRTKKLTLQFESSILDSKGENNESA